jgi:hypothetical protein
MKVSLTSIRVLINLLAVNLHRRDFDDLRLIVNDWLDTFFKRHDFCIRNLIAIALLYPIFFCINFMRGFAIV